jgi:PhzF family phenazine biosynthesis protein
MHIPIYQIDAFTSSVFSGNPAAVCPLDQWLSDALLQSIAAENNLAETAFLVRRGDLYDLRWFTPTVEVDLCGHATLASAFVIFTELDTSSEVATFETRSGTLIVRQDGDMLAMDFPARPPEAIAAPEALVKALGGSPTAILSSRDYLVVYETEEEIRSLRPDMELLRTLDRQGVIVTAAGREADFVSRYFAPAAGIPEDPVTGSAHCTLTPYWADRLGKTRLRAHQVSARGGQLWCEHRGDRVIISGQAVKYLQGTISLSL